MHALSTMPCLLLGYYTILDDGNSYRLQLRSDNFTELGRDATGAIECCCFISDEVDQHVSLHASNTTCMHRLAPVYLVNDCQTISAIASKRHLWSADTGTLFVLRTTTTLGMRSFAVAGPHIWNSLPAALRTATLSPLAFARHLKTHLFDWDGQRRV